MAMKATTEDDWVRVEKEWKSFLSEAEVAAEEPERLEWERKRLMEHDPKFQHFLQLARLRRLAVEKPEQWKQEKMATLEARALRDTKAQVLISLHCICFAISG